MPRDTLVARALEELVPPALDAIPGHAVIREPGNAIEPGLRYVGRLVTVLSDFYSEPASLFSSVGEETIVLHDPPRPAWKRPRPRR